MFEVGYLALDPENPEFIQRSFDFGGDVVNRIYFALREQVHESCLSRRVKFHNEDVPQ